MALDLAAVLADIKTKDYRDNNGTFEIRFVTAHRIKRNGGEFIHLEKACRAGLPPNCDGHEMIGLRDMETGKPYAVHNRLILDYNKQEVFWK